MTKLEKKLNLLEKIIGYCVVCIFGILAYIFVNYDNLSAGKTIILFIVIFVFLTACGVLGLFYIDDFHKLKD
ncbi:hypothetical protein [Campylobacter vulpis]|uniref:hypothetical protein n=1 Tax=Campylobacter vulpis TaxID=1655500 RepID=UPI001BCAB8BF|nr:hypothetical protein [Campylobacter vulpis]MBS4407596.1 hypothetical protein [Campylobacter vulpis]